MRGFPWERGMDEKEKMALSERMDGGYPVTGCSDARNGIPEFPVTGKKVFWNPVT